MNQIVSRKGMNVQQFRWINSSFKSFVKAKMPHPSGCSPSNVRIFCFSLLHVVVHWMSLGFSLFTGQKTQFEGITSALENWDGDFSPYFHILYTKGLINVSRHAGSFDKEQISWSNSPTVFFLLFCSCLNKVGSHIHILGSMSSLFSVHFFGWFVVNCVKSEASVFCQEKGGLSPAGIELLPHMRNLGVFLTSEIDRLQTLFLLCGQQTTAWTDSWMCCLRFNVYEYFCHNTLKLITAFIMHLFLTGCEGHSSEYLLLVLSKFYSCQSISLIHSRLMKWPSPYVHLYK